MIQTVTLYLGNTDADRTARQTLQRWCRDHHVSLSVESIHADPAAALRLHITQLPALVVANAVIAQGPPDDWLTDPFMDALAQQLDCD